MEVDGSQSNLLGECLRMVIQSKVCPKTKPSEWLKILMCAHVKGYLYTNNDKSSFAIGWRIPEWKEEYSDRMPEEESGNILYVSVAVSENDNNLGLLKMLRSYPDIEEVYWYSRNSDKNLKKFRIRRLSYGKV